MGRSFEAVCNVCGARFKVSDGGGFLFHLLHCDRCGKGRSIEFDELGEIHFRYIKGLPDPYGTISKERYKCILENLGGEPLSERDYYIAVEKYAGQCRCGGSFKFDAPARCPRCKSKSFQECEDGEIIMYD